MFWIIDRMTEDEESKEEQPTEESGEDQSSLVGKQVSAAGKQHIAKQAAVKQHIDAGLRQGEAKEDSSDDSSDE